MSTPDQAPIYEAAVASAAAPASAAALGASTPDGRNGDETPVTRATPLVPDLVELVVPRGGRVVIVSDLHLSAPVTEASRNCTAELARTFQ